MRLYSSSRPVRFTINLNLNFDLKLNLILCCGASQFRLYATARSKMPKILCVAEKPSISKAVAGHLSGGQFQTASHQEH